MAELQNLSLSSKKNTSVQELSSMSVTGEAVAGTVRNQSNLMFTD